MITPQLQAEIAKAINVRILSIAPLSAANNAQIYRINTDNKKTLVAKVAERGLDTEAMMLGYLKKNSKLPVPEIYYSNEHVILMQYIDSQSASDDAGQIHAADLLVELHAIKAEEYGFDGDTLIGMLRQPNPKTKDWCAFYAEHRLLFMGREALREKKIDNDLMKRIEKLAGKLPQYIKNPNPPSLVHGDIWGGNILFSGGRVKAFLDPAIYYADYEVELAFIKLFNTFGATFFSRYEFLSPLQPGFHEERADIYNIYPLLVHARLFGMSYARKAQKLVEKFT